MSYLIYGGRIVKCTQGEENKGKYWWEMCLQMNIMIVYELTEFWMNTKYEKQDYTAYGCCCWDCWPTATTAQCRNASTFHMKKISIALQNTTKYDHKTTTPQMTFLHLRVFQHHGQGSRHWQNLFMAIDVQNNRPSTQNHQHLSLLTIHIWQVIAPISWLVFSVLIYCTPSFLSFGPVECVIFRVARPPTQPWHYSFHSTDTCPQGVHSPKPALCGQLCLCLQRTF